MLDRAVKFPDGWLPGTPGVRPLGIAKNATTIEAEDGAPWDKDYINDIEGVFQGAVLRRNVTISGVPDTGSVSDVLDAFGLMFGLTHATISDAVADATLKKDMLITTVDNNSTARGGGANYLVKTIAQASADGDVVPSEFNFNSGVAGLVLILQDVSGAESDLDIAHEFPTVAAYKAFGRSFPVGKAIHLQDRKANFLVIAGTGSATGYKIIASDQVSQSIDLIIDNATTSKSFGAKGDWNATSVTGTDDTLAVQSWIDYYSNLGAQLAGGTRQLNFGSGGFRLTDLTIPAIAGAGMDFNGLGIFSTTLFFDESSPNPGIDSEIEFVNFNGMSVIGAIDASVTSDNARGVFYRGKKPSNRLDVDVKFSSTVRMTKWKIGVQAYGRGVTFDGGICSDISDSVLEIVADPSAVFDASRNQLLETSMRNYNFLNLRTDGVDFLINVVGTGAHKDFINDVKIIDCDFISTSRLFNGDDATYRAMVIEGNTAVSSFSGGVGKAKSIIGITDTGNDWKNLFGGQVVVDTTDTILNLYETTGALRDLTVNATSLQPLESRLIDCGAGSGNITISDCKLPKAFEAVIGASSRYIVFSTGDIENLTITDNTISGAINAEATNPRFYDIGNQTSLAYVSRNNSDYVWNDWRIPFTPVLRSGGTSNALTGSYGRIIKTDQYIELVIQVAAASLLAGSLTIDLPSNAPAAIPEDTGISATYSGLGDIPKFSGFSKVGYSMLHPNVNSGSNSISLRIEKDLGNINLDGSDTTGAITLFMNVRYRYI